MDKVRRLVYMPRGFFLSMARSVTVQKLKYNGTVRSAWEGELLESPNDKWVLVAHYPQRHLKTQNGKTMSHERLFVHGFHRCKPVAFLIEYNHNLTVRDIKCDATLPAKIGKKKISFVDLDLDLIVTPTLKYHVRDQVAFAKRVIRWGYPRKVRRQAYAGIKHAKLLVKKEKFPFKTPLYPKLKLKI